jgi:hypothetical protein
MSAVEFVVVVEAVGLCFVCAVDTAVSFELPVLPAATTPLS